MGRKPLLLKQTRNEQELANIINSEILPTGHLSRKFILDPVNHSNSAHTRNLNSQHLVMD
jgi:hypothetical protein